MSRTLGDLLLRIGADLSSFQQLRDQLGGAKDSIAQFVTSAESLSLNFERAFTVPFEHAAERLVEFQSEFKEASNEIIRDTGAIGDQLQRFSDSFKTVLGQVDETASEVSTTIGLLANRFDLSGDALEKLTKKYLDFAQATGGDVKSTVQETVKLFSQWSVATEDQTEKLNLLMRAAQAAAVPVLTIEQTMTQFGPALREAGIGFDQATLLIANLAKAGVELGPTLGGIQRALANLGKAGIADPLEGLQLLADKIKNASSEGEAFGIGATAFGKGAASMVEAIRSGKISFDDFAGSLKLGTREISETADEVQTLGETWNQTWNAIKLAFEPVAEALGKALVDLMVAARPLIDWVKEQAKAFAELSPRTQEIIFGVLGLVAAIGPLAGMVAAVGFAFEALAGVLVPLAALVGPILVPALLALGAAIAGWAIYEAVNKIRELQTNLQSLEDMQARGVKASQDQADQIAVLTAAIDKYNSVIGNKNKIAEVSQFAPSGQALTPEEYIKALQAALEKVGGPIAAFGGQMKGMATAAGVAAEAAKDLDLSIEGVAKSSDAAGTAAHSWSGKTTAAVDKVLEKFSAMKQIEEQIKQLEEIVGEKSLPIKQLQRDDLQRRAFAPTAQDADTTWSEYFSEVVKLNRAASIQTSDDVLTKLADLKTRLQQSALDTQTSFQLLGLTSEADIARQVQTIQVAYAKIYQSQIATDNDRTRALIATQEKVVALWRQTGQQIADDDILVLAKMKADWAAATLDIGTAFANLGVTSSAQVDNGLEVVDAALAKIRKSVEAGKATQLDADNAEIASLQRKAQAFQQLGKQMADDEVARLNQLTTARQIAGMTTEGAFAFFGIPSEQDLDNAISVITAAFDKIAASETTTDEQLNAARAAELGRMIDQYKKAGQQVTSDMLEEWKNRTAAAQRAALDIDQAFKTLSTLSTVDVTNQIALLDAAFKKLSSDAQTTAGQVAVALVAQLQGTLDALRKEGKAASDELVAALDAAKVKLKEATMNLDDAFSQLGIKSTQSIADSAELAQAALDKILASTKTSLFDRLQAQIAYQDSVYQLEVATGQKTDELANAQNKLLKERLAAALSDQNNIFIAFANTVKGIYSTIQNDLTDVIIGAKSLGQAFEDIGKVIEKALVDYVVKNLLLTQGTLNKLTDSLLGLLKQLVGGFGGGGGLDVGGIGGGFIGGTGGGSGAGGAAGSVSSTSPGGLLGQLSNLTNVLGLVVSAISAIVQGIEGARMITLLGRIEESTRRTDIATEQGPLSIAGLLATFLPSIKNIDEYLWGTQIVALNTVTKDLEDLLDEVNQIYIKVGQIATILLQSTGASSSGPPDQVLQALYDIDGVLRGIHTDTTNIAYAVGQLVLLGSMSSSAGAGGGGETATQSFRSMASEVNRATAAIGGLASRASTLSSPGFSGGVQVPGTGSPGVSGGYSGSSAVSTVRNPDGSYTTTYADGSVVTVRPDGSQTITGPAAAALSASIGGGIPSSGGGGTASALPTSGWVPPPLSAAERSAIAAAQAAFSAPRQMESSAMIAPPMTAAEHAALQAALAALNAPFVNSGGGIVPGLLNPAPQSGPGTFAYTPGSQDAFETLLTLQAQNEANRRNATRVSFDALQALNQPLSAPAVAGFLGGPALRGSPYGLSAVPDSRAGTGGIVVNNTVSGITVMDDAQLRILMSRMETMFNDSLRRAGLLR